MKSNFLNIRRHFEDYCQDYLNNPDLKVTWLRGFNGILYPELDKITRYDGAEYRHLKEYFNILLRYESLR